MGVLGTSTRAETFARTLTETKQPSNIGVAVETPRYTKNSDHKHANFNLKNYGNSSRFRTHYSTLSPASIRTALGHLANFTVGICKKVSERTRFARWLCIGSCAGGGTSESASCVPLPLIQSQVVQLHSATVATIPAWSLLLRGS